MPKAFAGRIMGMDASLRSSGIAVIESAGSALKTVAYHVVKNPPDCPLAECLARIFREVGDVLKRCRPEASAVEGIFFCKNFKTAIALGQARGAALAACAFVGVPIYEYPPRRVKQAVVGYGSASKEQVRKMVMMLLRLREKPQNDAADALAVAICHAHAARHFNILNTKQL